MWILYGSVFALCRLPTLYDELFLSKALGFDFSFTYLTIENHTQKSFSVHLEYKI
jgi:hypothetical protein